MATDCEYLQTDELSIFPESLVYILVDGFSATVPQKKRGLGRRTMLTKSPTASIKVLLTANTDTAVFTEWWVSEIDYGTKQFIIEETFFGIKREWLVSAKNDITQALQIGHTSEIVLELKIHDDLKEVIKNQEGVCND